MEAALTESPGGGAPPRSSQGSDGGGSSSENSLPKSEVNHSNEVDSEQKKKTDARNALHPIVQILSPADVESCVKVENAAFPEYLRCSREKFMYRLSTCGELSLGLFSLAGPASTTRDAASASVAHAMDSAMPEEKGVLLAMIIATKSTANVVTDESMVLPHGWEKGAGSPDEGHQEDGKTLTIHSLAVLPGYQRMGLGKTLMKAYIQRMKDSCIIERVALICHNYLVLFYESCGFEHKGESKAQFGGGGWHDMIIEFKDSDSVSSIFVVPVPSSQEFLDIVLSRTQRRLPTQIRSGFQISHFYTRKVKYTQETFCEKLSAILEGFPRLQDIHPFHKDLLNTLYDADHFRIALGQLSTAKHLIETVSRDYVRLLKYAQSLFQCKQLKRAALGRMATICRRLKDPLLYLEQVRQHLSRLPSIDPNTRTLLICGYPNVGKSSFLKSVTRADVDVQPYAFTTKSLFVGHFDYKYLRFQAIDTPGILDHPLEEMNTIEMQSITAIAHLRSAILYFMDLSEQCGYSVTAQLQLFQSIKPLFSNKLVFMVINKIDVMRPEDLDSETQEQLQAILKPGDVEMLQLSCTTTEGVTEVKNAACERLIADRVAQKLKAGSNSAGTVSGRLGDVLTRIHVAQPMGGMKREVFIPDAIKNKRRYTKEDPERPLLERDIEEQEGGAGVYNIDLKKRYLLENDEWKHDKVPEIFDGKNVYDYVDPDIEVKLAALEEEEEKLEAEGYYDSDVELEDAGDADIRAKAELIREKRQLIRNAAKMKKSLKNRAVIPRTKTRKKLSAMEDHLDSLGHDTTNISERARSQSRGRTSLKSRASTEDGMDVDTPSSEAMVKAKSRARSQSNRREDGVTSMTARSKADRLAKLGQQKMNRMARQGEADRHTTAALPKHLFSGKRGMGKTQRR
ncbi:MAG: Nucleolar GTP-binding protein 1 [Pycnora praestabilis]|nr:MAG: Nucleolar GTP-binding protein 1 [Pycnora praestabilis]